MLLRRDDLPKMKVRRDSLNEGGSYAAPKARFYLNEGGSYKARFYLNEGGSYAPKARFYLNEGGSYAPKADST